MPGMPDMMTWGMFPSLAMIYELGTCEKLELSFAFSLSRQREAARAMPDRETAYFCGAVPQSLAKARERKKGLESDLWRDSFGAPGNDNIAESSYNSND